MGVDEEYVFGCCLKFFNRPFAAAIALLAQAITRTIAHPNLSVRIYTYLFDNLLLNIHSHLFVSICSYLLVRIYLNLVAGRLSRVYKCLRGNHLRAHYTKFEDFFWMVINVA